MTRVIFRCERDGSWPTAWFPNTVADPFGNVLTYQHIGQHGAGSRDYYQRTRAAKPEEYAALLRELQQIGYTDLKLYKRWGKA